MSELRKDPVVGRWVIIATERAKRPTDYVSPKQNNESANCPFCEGNEHMTPPEVYAVRDNNTHADTKGWEIRVVTNKFPALSPTGTLTHERDGIFERLHGTGAHEVIIETTGHHDFLQQRSNDSLIMLLDTYRLRMEFLMQDKRLLYTQIFKNKGAQAGASLSHPHTQIIATPVVPKTIEEEINGSHKYFNSEKRCVYCDIIGEEKKTGERIVYENDSFISFCPYASRFPFEIWLIPKHHKSNFIMIDSSETAALADCLKITMEKLMVSLGDPQYNYLLHTVPNMAAVEYLWPEIDEYYHYHFEIFPKLTKIAGFEWGTGIFINPTPPKDAAAFLRGD
ncbi:galactose-1-phosphate uridylyltransferase [Candidatus Latescibacterota bacterium]